MRTLVPNAPDWRIDWKAVLERIPVLDELKTVPQDPRYHAEGDVFTHTQMVTEALVSDREWRGLLDPERRVVFLAALLHDIGKSKTTRPSEDGGLTSRGHSRQGARAARRLLWEANVPFVERELIVHLIACHQVPFRFLEREDSDRLIRRISQSARCDLLVQLARADAKGRIADNIDASLESLELFEESARLMGCLSIPFAFASPYGRCLYFKEKWKIPELAPHEAFRSRVTILSGLPGAGKDHWIQHNVPGMTVVSLDAIRRALRISPEEPQGRVVQAAREAARVHLRAFESFVWNATHVSAEVRERSIDLALQYGAFVEIVYVEPTFEQLFAQNQNRTHAVPRKVISDLIDRRLEVPESFEAVRVEWAVST